MSYLISITDTKFIGKCSDETNYKLNIDVVKTIENKINDILEKYFKPSLANGDSEITVAIEFNEREMMPKDNTKNNFYICTVALLERSKQNPATAKLIKKATSFEYLYSDEAYLDAFFQLYVDLQNHFEKSPSIQPKFDISS